MSLHNSSRESCRIYKENLSWIKHNDEWFGKDFYEIRSRAIRYVHDDLLECWTHTTIIRRKSFARLFELREYKNRFIRDQKLNMLEYFHSGRVILHMANIINSLNVLNTPLQGSCTHIITVILPGRYTSHAHFISVIEKGL